MSEPLNAIESDDVLSSLRRLVAEGPSDDHRIEARDKLILTPALRVVAPQPDTPPAAADLTADLTDAITDDLSAAVEDQLPYLSPQDEAILREIIRDVIREELQGALGERITRNMRKLVRAEIARTQGLRDKA